MRIKIWVIHEHGVCTADWLASHLHLSLHYPLQLTVHFVILDSLGNLLNECFYERLYNRLVVKQLKPQRHFRAKEPTSQFTLTHNRTFKRTKQERRDELWRSGEENKVKGNLNDIGTSNPVFSLWNHVIYDSRPYSKLSAGKLLTLLNRCQHEKKKVASLYLP